MAYTVRPESMERITTPELAKAFIDEQVAEIRAQVGDKKVLLALSGGVDSSVVAALLIKAIGKQLVCVHVNHGLMRKGESEQVIEVFGKALDANLVYVDATDRFLDLLAGVSDPEKKRKVIGAEFINVFDEESAKLEGIAFLAQGTIYPDILESIKAAESGKPVKSHHNVGGLPEDMKMELVEPIKLLFKDEVRVVGEALGLPHGMVYRQPFPGPVWASAAWVPSPATVCTLCVRLTPFCAKNSTSAALLSMSGSTLSPFPMSRASASAMRCATKAGPPSSAPSTPLMPCPPPSRRSPTLCCTTSPTASPTKSRASTASCTI